MLKTLSALIPWPNWARHDERYKRLAIFDLFLEGKFYDHMDYPFSQEEDVTGKYIDVYSRRPSAIYNLPKMVAKLCSRKLFAGKHAPTIMHEDQDFRDRVQKLTEEAELAKLMLQVATWGSVGSVGMTFRIVGDGEKGKARCFPWKAKWCRPKFDMYGNLSLLRVCYISTGYEFMEKDILTDSLGKPLKPDQNYWRIIDFGTMSEKTYVPIPENKWKPLDGDKGLRVDEETDHELGFVPGHWFQNLSGGIGYDGDCTFESALPMCIEMDVTLSSVGRGARYNACPQVVTKGSLVNSNLRDGGKVVRSPQIMLMFKGGIKQGDTHREAGDAKLLEMTGDGIKVTLDLVKNLEKLALKQIAAIRKDPDNVSGLITGKAMELLDEDIVDLVQELRTTYGDNGYLPFVKRMALGAAKANHPLMEGATPKQIDGLFLDWPRTYMPTPDEVQKIVGAMVQAVGTPGGVDASGKTTPASPQLLRPDQAISYLENNIDLPRASANRTSLEMQREQKEDLLGEDGDDTVTPSE